MVIPVERYKIVIQNKLVIAEHKTIERLCIYNGSIKCLKYIILNHNTLTITAVEIFCLSSQIWNLGIDRNHTVCKLEHICKCVHKTVL